MRGEKRIKIGYKIIAAPIVAFRTYIVYVKFVDIYFGDQVPLKNARAFASVSFGIQYVVFFAEFITFFKVFSNMKKMHSYEYKRIKIHLVAQLAYFIFFLGILTYEFTIYFTLIF
jgi:hypothetical protein